MKPGIDPKVDYVFKRIFGSEDQKNVLAHLLNAVLQPAPGEEVVSVILMNPFSEKDAEEDKVVLLDLLACDRRASEGDFYSPTRKRGAFRNPRWRVGL